jgi:hypothetical protein
MSEFYNWNDLVLQRLEEIRNNIAPVGEGAGAVNLKVSDVLVSHTDPLPIGDNGGSITVDGAVQIANLPEVQPVSGSLEISNYPAVQPVSGSLEISNYPAVQPVSGAVEIANLPAIQPVSGSVSITNLPGQYATSQDFGTASAFVVKASAGDLFSLCGHNLSTSCTRYLQLFNSATVPATGDVPILFFPVCSGNSWLIGADFFGFLGHHFSQGITWGWSNTARSYSPVQSVSEHATFANYQ